MTKATFPAAKDSCFLRKLSALVAGTAMAAVVLAGGLTFSSAANAQGSQSPEACFETCQKELQSCTDQQITKELCTHEHNVCRKQCEKK